MRNLAGLVVMCTVLTLVSCKQLGLYERLTNINSASWDRQQQPEMKFVVSDTVATYRFYVVVRHTNSYPYRNLWVNLGLLLPGDTSFKIQRFDVPLASTDQWLGKGMDDVYEHRQLLFAQPVKFDRKGTLVCRLQQDMRQNPLPGMLQVGIRLEKVDVGP